MVALYGVAAQRFDVVCELLELFDDMDVSEAIDAAAYVLGEAPASGDAYSDGYGDATSAFEAAARDKAGREAAKAAHPAFRMPALTQQHPELWHSDEQYLRGLTYDRLVSSLAEGYHEDAGHLDDDAGDAVYVERLDYYTEPESVIPFFPDLSSSADEWLRLSAADVASLGEFKPVGVEPDAVYIHIEDWALDFPDFELSGPDHYAWLRLSDGDIAALGEFKPVEVGPESDEVYANRINDEALAALRERLTGA
jgi:hypothetical protein